MPEQLPYRLGTLLVRRGLISDKQLSEAVLAQRQYNPPIALGRVLVDLGFVSHKDIKRCLKRQRCLRWYAAISALLSAPSAAFCQDLTIEDYPEYQHTQVAELDGEGFHLDAEAHYHSAKDHDIFIAERGNSILSGSLAVTVAVETSVKALWHSYTESDAENAQFDFAVAASPKGYGVIMNVKF